MFIPFSSTKAWKGVYLALHSLKKLFLNTILRSRFSMAFPPICILFFFNWIQGCHNIHHKMTCSFWHRCSPMSCQNRVNLGQSSYQATRGKDKSNQNWTHFGCHTPYVDQNGIWWPQSRFFDHHLFQLSPLLVATKFSVVKVLVTNIFNHHLFQSSQIFHHQSFGHHFFCCQSFNHHLF
jgi:hypothetical protein